MTVHALHSARAPLEMLAISFTGFVILPSVTGGNL